MQNVPAVYLKYTSNTEKFINRCLARPDPGRDTSTASGIHTPAPAVLAAAAVY